MLIACGISLGAGEDETDIFKQLGVEGDFSPGGALELTLEYAQQYPVAVDVECDLLAVDPEATATPQWTPVATSTPADGVTPTQVPIPKARPTPKHKVLEILVETLPAVGTPETWSPSETTPVPGTITGGFSVPARPGRYVVKCFTPDDDNNSISKDITIAPASAPTP